MMTFYRPATLPLVQQSAIKYWFLDLCVSGWCDEEESW